MIDITQPMELDDGRPAEYTRDGTAYGMPDNIEVRITGPWQRVGNSRSKTTSTYWYNRHTGIWDGASAKEAFVLRNVDEPVIEEDWS